VQLRISVIRADSPHRRRGPSTSVDFTDRPVKARIDATVGSGGDTSDKALADPRSA